MMIRGMCREERDGWHHGLGMYIRKLRIRILEKKPEICPSPKPYPASTQVRPPWPNETAIHFLQNGAVTTHLPAVITPLLLLNFILISDRHLLSSHLSSALKMFSPVFHSRPPVLFILMVLNSEVPEEKSWMLFVYAIIFHRLNNCHVMYRVID